MGVADIVPGVSGGTIAFITGIYRRLINGIKNLNINFLFSYVKYLTTKKKIYLGNFKKELSLIDFALFIPLGIGIAIAFAVGSMIIPPLIDNHPVFIFAFFFGLILGSIKILYDIIERPNIVGIAAGIFGFLISLVITSLETLTSNHSYPVVFFSGFVAISAMLLPGISGSFIMLILGQYRFMLDALRNIEVFIIFTFMVGAVFGLLSFARIMSFLLKRYHKQTILFLIGLMFGALRVPYDYISSNFSFDAFTIAITFVLCLLGAMLVIILGKIGPE